MKLQVLLIIGAVSAVGLCNTAAHADSYSSVTTEESVPVSQVTETRTTTVESEPVTTVLQSVPMTSPVIREQQLIIQPAAQTPVFVTQPAPEVIVVKQHHHHLINLGPVKVF
jgi:hypothetical protein